MNRLLSSQHAHKIARPRLDRRMRTYLDQSRKASVSPHIRAATISDVMQIHALIVANVGRAHLLARSETDITATLPWWFVAEQHGTIIGCGALVRLSPALVELRSLVVHPDYRGAGIGTQLLTHLIGRARAIGTQRILALTCAVPIFTRQGFAIVEKAAFPEKVSRDCMPCQLRDHCPEVAVVLEVGP